MNSRSRRNLELDAPNTQIAKTLFVTSLIIVFVLIIQALICIEAAKEVEGGVSCHGRELELCCVSAASIFQNPNGVPMSEAEFKRQCEYLDEAADCYESYGERCLTKQQHHIIEMFTGHLFGMEKEFCNSSSDMRKEYVKHVKCYRDVQKKYQSNCVSDLQVALEPLHKLDGVGARLSTGCCAVNRFKDCTLTKIEDECGNEASDAVQKWLIRGFGNMLNHFCRNYDPESETCARILPKEGSKPHNGRNTSALSRVVSTYTRMNTN